MEDKPNIPTIKLNSGYDIPIFGLGTWRSESGEAIKAVEYAIDIGYRSIDCAFVYENEKEVGIAIANKIAEGKIKREDLYITSKLWNTYHRPDLVEGALKLSLKDLGVEYLDLYLMHFPYSFKEGSVLIPLDAEGKRIHTYVDYVDTWKAMEKLVSSGLVKSIGVSNFNKRQIERVLEIATIPPAMNQVECHPYLNQKRLIEFCASKGIAVTAYSPLGSPSRPWAEPDEPVLLDDPKLKELANKHGKSVAQILLRYHVERGVIIIPKSGSKSRIAENFNIFDFQLSSDDMNYIDTFDCNKRFFHLSQAVNHPYHPFANDEF